MAAVSERPASAPEDGRSTLRLFRHDRADRLDDLGDIPRRLGRSALLWIDLQQAPEEVVGGVTERLGLDDETARALGGDGAGPGFRDRGEFVHVTAHAPGDGDGLERVECVVGESWVVTAHDGPVPVLEGFAELTAGSGPTGELDGPAFLAALLEWVLNEHAMALERLEEELEEFDVRAMSGRGKPEEVIDDLLDLRRRAGRLRRSLVAHRPSLLALTHPELEALTDTASARRFQALLEHYETTLQIARDARESIVSSFDVLIARTGHRTNETMKLLTLASVIFLPGALLAGVMGMNFKVPVFEHTIGFWLTLGAITAIAVVTIAVARLKRWI
jgi:Mg2+ and Co2+ transporter CorA